MWLIQYSSTIYPRLQNKISWLFLLIALFTLVFTVTLGKSFQEVSQKRMVVDDWRPVAKAIRKLEEQFKWVITYEDPQYMHDSDIVDITNEVRKDSDRMNSEKAVRILAPKKGRLEFTYNFSGSLGISTNPILTVQSLLDAQAARGIGGKFRLENSGKIIHVLPAAIKNRSGSTVAQSSMLDTVISLSSKDETVYEKIVGIRDAIQRSTGKRIAIASYPSMFHSYKYKKGAIKRKARDIILEMFAEINHGSDLSWELNYAPGLNIYLLNIYHVQLLDGKW